MKIPKHTARRNGARCCNLNYFFLAALFLCFAWDASNVALSHTFDPVSAVLVHKRTPELCSTVRQPLSLANKRHSHSRPNKYSSTTVLHKLRRLSLTSRIQGLRWFYGIFFSPLRRAHASADGYVYMGSCPPSVDPRQSF